MEVCQIILVVISGVGALYFLFRKFIFKSKSLNNKNCDTDCNCH